MVHKKSTPWHGLAKIVKWCCWIGFLSCIAGIIAIAQTQQSAQSKMSRPILTKKISYSLEKLVTPSVDTENADNWEQDLTQELQQKKILGQQSVRDRQVKAQAIASVLQFHDQVDGWAKAHLYQDDYDGKSYALNDGYGKNALGGLLDQHLKQASSGAEYQQVLDQAQRGLFLEKMQEADSEDQTPFDQSHKTDLQILKHEDLITGSVIVITLDEQALRMYNHGKLQKSFRITSGRPELPSLPGIWRVLRRRSPMTFKSPDKPDSPLWFPDSPVQYALLYHEGGYYVHDANWRQQFGPGTQFPHDDQSNGSYSETGSHGCVNLTPDDAKWVYQHTNLITTIVIY